MKLLLHILGVLYNIAFDLGTHFIEKDTRLILKVHRFYVPISQKYLA